MPYPAAHLYLTLHWRDSRVADEGGQVGIRFDSPGTTATQAMVDAAAPVVQTFWTAAGAAIPPTAILEYLRLATIGTDGRYVAETFSKDYVWASGVQSSVTNVQYPLQVASVATFETAAPSGQAARGRIYLPPISSALLTDARWSSTACNNRATALATMLTGLNDAMGPAAGAAGAVASVFSKGTTKNPAGLRRFITGVKVGNRPDVQRRRAKQMPEVYSNVSAVQP